MSSVTDAPITDFFTPNRRLRDAVIRYKFFIAASFLLGIFIGATQKSLSSEYHARAIIDVGYSKDFIPVEPLADIARKIRADIENPDASNIRTALLENQEYKKMTVTVVATLKNDAKSKEKFEAVIERHLLRIASLEKKSKVPLETRTSRMEPPSTNLVCTAGCRTSFSVLYGFSAALIALAACMLFDHARNAPR